jgi:hypothetical protein
MRNPWTKYPTKYMTGTTTIREMKGFTPNQLIRQRLKKLLRIIRSPWARFTSFTIPNIVDIPIAITAYNPPNRIPFNIGCINPSMIFLFLFR